MVRGCIVGFYTTNWLNSYTRRVLRTLFQAVGQPHTYAQSMNLLDRFIALELSRHQTSNLQRHLAAENYCTTSLCIAGGYSHLNPVHDLVFRVPKLFEFSQLTGFTGQWPL
jgi:hypothetical protein